MSNVFIGPNARNVTSGEKLGQFTGVKLWLDDENYVFAGSNANVLEASCAWATQAIADSVLSVIRGKAYSPYDAESATVHPAAELGDGVNVGDVFSGIYSQDLTFSRLPVSNISAVHNEEVDHEYEFVSSANRKNARDKEAIRTEFNSELNVLSDSVVAKVGGNSQSFGWSLTADGFILSSGGSQVFKCDSDGIVVNGSGTFTGTITSSNATITGGSLSVGSNFSVDSSGNLTANNATITGTLTVGGNAITAASLYTGASQAASNYSTWSGTSSTVSTYSSNWSTGYNWAYGNASSFANFSVNGTYVSYCQATYVTASSYLKGRYLTVNGYTYAQRHQVTCTDGTVRYVLCAGT